MTCTFETAFSCGYISNEGHYTWRRQSGATQSFYTGPVADHTLGDTTGNRSQASAIGLVSACNVQMIFVKYLLKCVNL